MPQATNHTEAIGRVEYAPCPHCSPRKTRAYNRPLKIVATQRAEEVGDVYEWQCQKCRKRHWHK